MKARKPKKIRRVVLGTGYPLFIAGTRVIMCAQTGYGQSSMKLNYDDLGNYNKIRLVAEVLK